jgi:hypothetical protein
MTLKPVSERKTKDMFKWRCNTHKNKELSIRNGSFFAKSKLPLHTLMCLVYFWSTCTSNTLVEEYLNVSSATSSQWIGWMRDIPLRRLCENPVKLGGPGKTVEIDETMLVKKWKNFRGDPPPQLWFFGGFCRETGEIFGEFVKTRNRSSLVELVKKYILPETLIVSDEWSGYWSERFNLSHLAGMNYRHIAVAHVRNFVDPETGACTNGVEGMWGNIKARFRAMHGTIHGLKPSYLKEVMWRAQIAGQARNCEKRSEIFVHALAAIAFYFGDYGFTVPQDQEDLYSIDEHLGRIYGHMESEEIGQAASDEDQENSGGAEEDGSESP